MDLVFNLQRNLEEHPGLILIPTLRLEQTSCQSKLTTMLDLHLVHNREHIASALALMKKQGETRQRWQEMQLSFQRIAISTVWSLPMRITQMCSRLQRISTSLWINLWNLISKARISRQDMVHSQEFLNKMESLPTCHKALRQTDFLQNESTSSKMLTSLMVILTSDSVATLPWGRLMLNTMLKIVQTSMRETMRLTYVTTFTTMERSEFKPQATLPRIRWRRSGSSQRQLKSDLLYLQCKKQYLG